MYVYIYIYMNMFNQHRVHIQQAFFPMMPPSSPLDPPPMQRITAGQDQEFLGSAGDQVAVRRASLSSNHVQSE